MTVSSQPPALSHLVREYFAAKPNAMTMIAARELGIPEAKLLGLLPGKAITVLDQDRIKEMLMALEEVGKVRVIVSNASTTVELFGQFGGFSEGGGFVNVQTRSLDMHLRADRLASAYAVRKPSHLDGIETLSLQFFDSDGDSAFKVFLSFGVKTPKDEARRCWESFREKFATGS